MTTGDVPDGISHGENGQPEGNCNAMQADAHIWKRGSQYRAAAATENEPERSKKLRSVSPHVSLLWPVDEYNAQRVVSTLCQDGAAGGNRAS